jgi:TatD DNase family protein
MWFDSHCHLDFEQFTQAEGTAAVVANARLHRVSPLITIATHISRAKTYTNIAEQFDDVYTTMGIHPHHGAEETTNVAELVRLSQHPKVVAIGEAGLDYHYDFVPKDVQATTFRTHVQAARAANLPLIIHAREADCDMVSILQDELRDTTQGPLKGVMHCFSSTQKLAEFALSIGFYISFSGVLTFPRATDLQELAKILPLDRLLVETDAPYLAPKAYRGQRNEPAYVAHTGRFLAELRGLDELACATQLRQNFFELFSKINIA